ncbi:hypothetical protein BLOT_004908, partial [Blomia tropicalis]
IFLLVEMKTLIKTFDILFLLTFILQQVDLKKEPSLKLQRKKCNKNEFESIFSRIVVFSEPDRTFPETEAKVPAFCAETANLVNRFENYKNKCLKETTKNFVGILSYSIKVQIKKLCTKKIGPKTRALLNAAPCINRNSEKVSKCMDKLSFCIRCYSKSGKPFKDTKHMLLQDCFKEIMYSDNCESHYPILHDQIHNVMGNYIDSTCGDYNPDTDKCEKMPPLPKIDKKLKYFLHNNCPSSIEILNLLRDKKPMSMLLHKIMQKQYDLDANRH